MIPKRIDPHSLLKCLGILLNTSGGIKSKEDVARIVSLMSKFSKKLVSKCVYVEILHATSDELLGVYMEDGGWELVSTWIKESVASNNGPLLETLLTLTLKSDLSLTLLELNDCPKCVKNLTSIAPNERVKSLACEIVARWIEVAKRGLQPADLEKVEAACKNSQIQLPPAEPIVMPAAMTEQDQPDQNKALSIQDIQNEVSLEEDEEVVEAEEEEVEEEEDEEEDEEMTPEEEEDSASRPMGELPVFKITIRDGKQVLATVSSAKPSPVNIPAEEVKMEIKIDEPASETVKVELRGASRRKQQLKPVNEPMIMSETEKKRVAAQEKKSARIEKELEAKRAEKLFKEKNRKLKEKLADREAKQKALKQKEQEEKDQATLAKLMGTSNKVSLGKIPKKVKSEDGDKKGSSESSRRSSADDDKRRKSDGGKSSGSSKDKKDSKSPSTKSSLANLQPVKHKVKTFNSKFRSTGLEEESPLPPPRGQSKKDLKEEKSPSSSSAGKRSPPPMGKEQTPPEKKSKLDEVVKKVNDKTRSKPATQLLQESNFFMDALDAGVKNEPRKRKRRVSSSKEESPTPAKAPSKEPTSPAVDKKLDKSSSASPTSVRPTFNFYTETLETGAKPDADAKETEDLENDKNSDSRTPTPPIDGIAEENSQSSELLEDVTKGVLVIHRSTRITDRVKKSVRFKSDEELVSVRYFELDETERVNVTKIGGDMNDMKMSDAAYERQVMFNSKKLDSSCEVVETNVPWILIAVDCPAPLAELGKNSTEKIVQREREMTVLQAIYFSPASIPDCPTEPEPENGPVAEPAVIPQEDLTGNPDSVKDFSHLPWAEPKGMQPALPVVTGGGWRTGDGQILSSNTQPPQFPPPNLNNFNNSYETGNPAANMGYQTPNFNPQDMSGMNPNMNGMNANMNGMPNMNGMNPNMNGINPNMMGMMNNMMMPGGPGFMQFPPNVNNFSAPPPGNWGPPMGPGGGPGGFRGRGMMNRGGPGRGFFGPPRGGRGMNRERTNACKHFARGFCRNGSSCNFKH